jgi:hypothetical protein
MDSVRHKSATADCFGSLLAPALCCTVRAKHNGTMREHLLLSRFVHIFGVQRTAGSTAL